MQEVYLEIDVEAFFSFISLVDPARQSWNVMPGIWLSGDVEIIICILGVFSKKLLRNIKHSKINLKIPLNQQIEKSLANWPPNCFFFFLENFISLFCIQGTMFPFFKYICYYDYLEDSMQSADYLQKIIQIIADTNFVMTKVPCVRAITIPSTSWLIHIE